MRILIIFFMLAGNIAFGAEWLACDIPGAEQDVTEYAIVIDSQPEVIVAYQLNAAEDAVLLYDITALDTGHFVVWAINSQGRRSTVSGPFDLKAKPSTLSGYRIILE